MRKVLPAKPAKVEGTRLPTRLHRFSERGGKLLFPTDVPAGEAETAFLETSMTSMVRLKGEWEKRMEVGTHGPTDRPTAEGFLRNRGS